MMHAIDHCMDVVEHKLSRHCRILEYFSPEKWEKPPHIGSINLLVAGVVFIILFMYWSLWIIFLRPFLETHTIQQFSVQLIMFLIHGTLFMMFWTYYVAGSINPGFVEPREVTLTTSSRDLVTENNNDNHLNNYDHIIDMSANLLATSSNAGTQLGSSIPALPDVYVTSELIEAAKLTAGKYIRSTYHQQVRWCRHCEAVKPSRAHHCRVCKRCVHRMDHHCPYIGNCVGYRNHKSFILFLLYINFGMILTSVLMLYRIISVSASPTEEFTSGELALIIINCLLLLGVLPGTMILMVNQLHGVVKNFTKIELWIRHWAIRDAMTANIHYEYPYDHGPKKNLKEYFGDSVLMWFFPTVPELTYYPPLVPQYMQHIFVNDFQNAKNKEET